MKTNKEILALQKGTIVSGATGRLTKVKAPQQQTEHDITRGRHRQRICITDKDGTDLWCVLEKEKMHVDPSCKGRDLIMESTPGDNGLVGITLERWEARGGEEMVEVAVSGAASVYFVEDVEPDQPEPQQPKPQPSAPPQDTGSTGSKPAADIITDHAIVLEACWNSTDFASEEKTRGALASTLFIELGKKALITKAADAIRERLEFTESISAMPDDGSPEPEPQPQPQPVPDAEPSEFVEAYDKLVEGKWHARFGMAVVNRAFDYTMKAMGTDNDGTCAAIAADPETFGEHCEMEERKMREEQEQDEIPMD